MSEAQWADPTMHAIAVYLDGTDAPDEADDGTPLLDDDFLILVNAFWEEVTFTIPPVREDQQTWFVELDSYDPEVSAARVFPRHTGDSVVARSGSCSSRERKASPNGHQQLFVSGGYAGSPPGRCSGRCGHSCASRSGKGTMAPRQG